MNWMIALYLFGLFPAFYFSVKYTARTPACEHEELYVLGWMVIWPVCAAFWIRDFIGKNTKTLIDSLIKAERERIEGVKNVRK